MQAPTTSLFSAGLSQFANSFTLSPDPPMSVHNDSDLASYSKELNELYMDIKQIYNEFKVFCKCICKSTDMLMDISRTRQHFYVTYHENEDDDSKEDIRPSYTSCSDNMATEAIKTFCLDEQFGNIILKALKQWITSIQSLKSEINHAQTVYHEMYEYNVQLQVLLVHQKEEEYEQQQSTGNILSGITDIIQQKSNERIANQISFVLQALDPLTDTFSKLKISISDQYKEIIENKYSKFDLIYGQILESQKNFYDYCHQQITLTKHKYEIQNKIEAETEEQQITFENMIDLNGNTHENNGPTEESTDVFSEVFKMNHPQKRKEVHQTYDYIENAFVGKDKKHDDEKDITDLLDI